MIMDERRASASSAGSRTCSDDLARTVSGYSRWTAAAPELLSRLKSSKSWNDAPDNLSTSYSTSLLVPQPAVSWPWPSASLAECELLYREFCGKVFSTPTSRAVRWLGMGRLLFSRGYYDSAALERFFRAFAGEMNLIDSRAVAHIADDPPCVFCVSTIVSENPAAPFLHTNYAPPPESKPRYRYAAHHRVYEALRATSAAPTYFDAFRCGSETFCDGAILVNNPTAIACHEAKLLWPDLPIDVLVSVGTGRCDPRLVSEPNQRVATAGSSGDSIFELARTLLSSATDTEAVHHAILDLTHGRDMYFRLNPDVAPLSMDESRIEKLEELVQVTRKYIEQNTKQFSHIAEKLSAGAARKEHLRAAL